MLERPTSFPARSGRLYLRSPYLEVGALVGSLGLAQDAVQPLDRLPNGTVRIENSCCWTSRESRPAPATPRRPVDVLEQRLLHRRDVVDALGDAAVSFEAREAVEFERVEAFRGLVHHRHARLDLRVGLDLDLAPRCAAG